MAGQIPRLQGKIQSQVRNENGLTSGIHKLTGKQTGKKKVKAIARALQKATRSPYTPSSHPRTPSGLPTDRTTLQQTTPNCPASFPLSDKRRNSTDHAQQNHNSPTPAKTGNPASSVPRSTPVPRSERQPLHSPGSRFSAAPVGSYGSIVATPPQQASAASDMASLELPGPAIDPGDDTHEHDDNRKIGSSHSNHSVRIESPQVSPRQPNPGSADGKSSTTKNRPHSSSDAGAKRKSQLLKLVFPGQDWDSGPEKHAQAEATSESERRQDEFFVFLDDELAKIESFYRMKEEESSRRLQMLRRQLHMMRDQRIQEVMAGAKKIAKKHDGKMGALKPGGLAGFKGNRLKDVFTGRNRFGENTEALEGMATTPGTLQSRDPETVTRQRDFSRRPDEDDSPNADVSYRSAKRKLKYALQEFYRGLELLKGYAYLNRTAFRKINKKYDKTVQARPTLRYISENVNKAWFVRSEVTENLMVATEDLYARYFERGNRKLAISKLRRTDKKAGDYSSNTFRSGLLLMAGLLFGIQSLIYVGQHMKSDDVTFRVQTSYLLQVSIPSPIPVFGTQLM